MGISRMFLQMPEQTAGNEPRKTHKRLLEAKLSSVRIRMISCDLWFIKSQKIINLVQWIILSYLMFGNIFWTIAVFKIRLEDFFFKFGKKINFPKNWISFMNWLGGSGWDHEFCNVFFSSTKVKNWRSLATLTDKLIVPCINYIS